MAPPLVRTGRFRSVECAINAAGTAAANELRPPAAGVSGDWVGLGTASVGGTPPPRRRRVRSILDSDGNGPVRVRCSVPPVSVDLRGPLLLFSASLTAESGTKTDFLFSPFAASGRTFVLFVLLVAFWNFLLTLLCTLFSLTPREIL